MFCNNTIRKVSLITFAVYVLSDEKNVLTPVKAFVCLTLFDILKLPLVLLPMLIVYIVEVNIVSNFTSLLSILVNVFYSTICMRPSYTAVEEENTFSTH